MVLGAGLKEGEFTIKKSENKEERYKEIKPRAALLFPLGLGIFMIFIVIMELLEIIFIEKGVDIPIFWYLILLLLIIFGGYCLNQAMKEYRYQKKHNIKWK